MRIRQLIPACVAALALAGCSPTYNWRDYTSADGAYRVLFPAKPATQTRSIDLDPAAPGAALEVDALGKGNAGPVRLVGRFVARGARMYQVIVVGNPGAMPPEHTEQFLSSFAPQ